MDGQITLDTGNGKSIIVTDRQTDRQTDRKRWMKR